MSKMWLMTTLVVLGSAAGVGAQQAPAPAGAAAQGRGRGGGQPVQPIEQVKPGLYVVAGGGANSLVATTPEGVILVDAKMPSDQNYDGLMAQIKTVTDKPVKYLIVTHHHADHTGNTQKFLEAGAQVIGHENLLKNLA